MSWYELAPYEDPESTQDEETEACNDELGLCGALRHSQGDFGTALIELNPSPPVFDNMWSHSVDKDQVVIGYT